MKRDQIFGTAAYFLIAATTLGAIYYLYYFSPVNYVRLVAEDQWGEYGTAVCYALAAVLLLVLARKPGQLPRRILYTAAGIFALIVSAEEISWGQRIFNLPTPEFFIQTSAQGEINFHNMPLTGVEKHSKAGFFCLFWALISCCLFLGAPQVAKRIEKAGWPLIPNRLQSLFLPVPYFFLARPMAKWSEIGELFLGIAVLAWAIDHFLRFGMVEVPRWRKAALMAGFLILGVFLAAAMTWIFPGSLKKRINITAARDYPAYGMPEQAEVLFRYIYAHPEYLLPETRINHARMLIETGQREQGIRILEEAKVELAKVPASVEREEPSNWTQVIYTLREETKPAEE